MPLNFVQPMGHINSLNNKTGWAKKNDTQMKPNNFYVICFLPLQFTHIARQHVQFLYLKGFFSYTKKKKVMAN